MATRERIFIILSAKTWKFYNWSHLSESNRRHAVYKTAALPAELRWHKRHSILKENKCQSTRPKDGPSQKGFAEGKTPYPIS